MNAKNFPWASFKVLFEGTSIIDIPRLELESDSEAHQFIMSYGFDLHLPAHLDRVWKIYGEAVDFIEHSLCTPETKIPAILKDPKQIGDFKKLLLSASGVKLEGALGGEKLSQWICGILRVMHTITHFDSDLRLKYLNKIKKQSLERFEAHIQRAHEDDKDKIYLGFERDKVLLYGFEKKEAKIRESILLKLLHKPENVAQEIYDHLGIRFITETRVEVFQVAKYLLDHHLISAANIMPSRCRNNLVDLENFHQLFLKTPEGENKNALMEENLLWPAHAPGHASGHSSGKTIGNPFSSEDYRALQFTTRPLIRIPVVRKDGIHSEMAFFFPLEVQILDRKSYLSIQTGDGKHSIYKQRQLDAVRSRVLKGI